MQNYREKNEHLRVREGKKRHGQNSNQNQMYAVYANVIKTRIIKTEPQLAKSVWRRNYL